MGKMQRPKPPPFGKPQPDGPGALRDSFTVDIAAYDAGKQLLEAMGASPGDIIHTTLPQFERPDGEPDPEKAPQSLDEWLALSSMSRDDLTRMGCRLWSEETQLMLFPGEWYNDIPEGLMVETVNGGSLGFDRDKLGYDVRHGMLAFGVRHT